MGCSVALPTFVKWMHSRHSNAVDFCTLPSHPYHVLPQLRISLVEKSGWGTGWTYAKEIRPLPMERPNLVE